jgi:hypothetical protein
MTERIASIKIPDTKWSLAGKNIGTLVFQTGPSGPDRQLCRCRRAAR